MLSVEMHTEKIAQNNNFITKNKDKKPFLMNVCMNRKSYTCAFLLFFSALSFQGYESHAQSAEIEKKIKKADAFLNIKDYSQALPLYLEIDKAAPKDPQTSYAIGVCYFNTPGQVLKSIHTLKLPSRVKMQLYLPEHILTWAEPITWMVNLMQLLSSSTSIKQ
jgi:hypothetical protein